MQSQKYKIIGQTKLVSVAFTAIASLMSVAPALAQTINAPSQEQTDLLDTLRGTGNGVDQEQSQSDSIFYESLDPEDAQEGQQAENQTVRRSLPLSTSAQGRARRVQSEPAVLDDINTATPSSLANVRQGAVEPGGRRAAEVDPFAAEGFRLGTWNGNASLEQVIGFSSNLDRTANGSSGGYSQADVAVSLQSDWSRHQTNIDASASYRRNFDGGDSAVPAANISGALRLDLADRATLTLTTGYNYSTEAITSTTIGADVSERRVFMG